MTFRGTVRNGKVELDDSSALADGTSVDVFPRKRGLDSVYRMFESGVNSKSVPADLASEHDHYVYGTPKRSRRAGVKSATKRGTAKTKSRAKGRKK